MGVLERRDARTGELKWSSSPIVIAAPPGFWPTSSERAWERLGAVDVSPDGKLVAAVTVFTRMVVLWDADTGERKTVVPVPDWSTSWALFFDWDGSGVWGCGPEGEPRFVPIK
jgi:hypothetical protein